MPDSRFTHLIDLALDRYGGSVLSASDDFFAEKENLVVQAAAVFKPDLYTERGKWMDGWESRRKRTPGNDWCVIKLGARGIVRGIDADTSHFRGNHPPHISLDAFDERWGDSLPPGDAEEGWTEILPNRAIGENSHNFVAVDDYRPWTHLRLQIYPDGGVARLRVYGEVVPDWSQATGEIELSAVKNGGRAVACSDEHFSRMANLLLPDASRNMGDGWETKRRRGPGHDWVVVRLGRTGRLSRVELDTTFYKGNFPDRCSLEGALALEGLSTAVWTTVLEETPMKADATHVFDQLRSTGPFSHLRLNIFPDGGVARMRAFGSIETTGLDTLNTASEPEARQLLSACCASSAWVDRMVSERPFSDREGLHQAAERAWTGCGRSDYLEAFAGHPRIGDSEALRSRFADDTWAGGEQSGAADASETVLEALAEGNRLYEERFGYIFIVCATGKSASEMLAMLRSRLRNRPADEIQIAAGEQAKITALRLDKMLDQSD